MTDRFTSTDHDDIPDSQRDIDPDDSPHPTKRDVHDDIVECTFEVRKLLFRAGFRPVPVYTGQKRPKGDNWRATALGTASLAEILRPEQDALNTGILCDGLRAIDIDIDDKERAQAVRDLAESRLGTTIVRTRSNAPRCLLLYRAAQGEPVKRVLKGDFGKVEILGAGQQFVAFWTHTSGAVLEWPSGFPGEVARSDLPALEEASIEEFLTLARPFVGATDPKSKRSHESSRSAKTEHTARNATDDDFTGPIADVVAALGAIPGDQGDYDFWIKIGMATWGATGGSEEGFQAWNSWSSKSPKYDVQACTKKWPTFAKADRIGIGTLVYEARKARPDWQQPSEDFADTDAEPAITVLNQAQQSPPKLPLRCFGPVWSSWIADAADGSNAAVDYVALPLLAAAAGLIGNARWARAWPGWEEPPVLWCAGVGDPSSGKSPGAKSVSEALQRVNDWMGRDYPQQYQQWTEQRVIAEAVQKDWERNVSDAVSESRTPPDRPDAAVVPEAPARPCAWVGNVTIEKLVGILARQPRGVLCKYDELAGLLSNLQRYSNGGSDRPFWLEAYTAGSYRMDRVKLDEPIIIPNLAVSIYGTIQPDKIGSLIRSADDGLTGRFLWSWPEAREFRRPTGAADINTVVNALCNLAELAMVEGSTGDKEPVYVPLDDEAARLMTMTAVRLQEAEQDAYGILKGSIGKARGQVLRLALILQYLWWSVGHEPEPTVIGKPALEAAIDLVENYFLPMARRVLADAAVPVEERNARTLAKWIAKTKPSMVNMSAIRDNQRLPGLRETRDVRAACSYLEDARWLIATRNVGPRGGRPRGDYRVNPRLWKVLK